MPSHPTLWRPILISVSHLRVGIQSSLFLRPPHQNPRTFGCFFHVIPHPFCPLCFRLAFLFPHAFWHGLPWTTRFSCRGPRFAPCSSPLHVSATVSASYVRYAFVFRVCYLTTHIVAKIICVSDTCTSMEHWWNDTEMGEPRYSRENVSECHFVHHKSHLGRN